MPCVSETSRADECALFDDESLTSESDGQSAAITIGQTDDSITDHHFFLERARTEESHLGQWVDNLPALPRPIHNHRSHSYSVSPTNVETRRYKNVLQLPSFSTIGIAHRFSSFHENQKQLQDPRIVMAPLLTPPPDDMSTSYFSSEVNMVSCSNTRASDFSNSEQRTATGDGEPARGSPIRSQLALNLSQARALVNEPSTMRHQPWVMKSTEIIMNLLGTALAAESFQVVSQTLPSQAKDGRSKPTFEDILEKVQSAMAYGQFITITHAVPQARTMEELPKTPPSTPRPIQSAEDYFTDDQSIFTHAAVVPIYHNHGPVNHTPVRIPHNISAPNIQISILERYIPPTMREEVSDFFSSTSKRSYLSDRLSELSPSNGSLLLVYPTRAGGVTFSQKYVGPVLDPFLRQFILLNDLTADAATAMGTLTAVDAMLDFDDMGERVEQLCQTLTQGPPIRGQRSRFALSHSETTKVTLDHPTWINWFVEQEQSRLRQNLVEYHQSGGRMPGARDDKEVTVGMLTREVIEGIRNSQKSTGGVGIEVGVFVITRSRIS